MDLPSNPFFFHAIQIGSFCKCLVQTWLHCRVYLFRLFYSFFPSISALHLYSRCQYLFAQLSMHQFELGRCRKKLFLLANCAFIFAGKSSNNDVSGSAESFNDPNGSVLSSQYRRLSSLPSIPSVPTMHPYSADTMYSDYNRVSDP